MEITSPTHAKSGESIWKIDSKCILATKHGEYYRCAQRDGKRRGIAIMCQCTDSESKYKAALEGKIIERLQGVALPELYLIQIKGGTYVKIMQDYGPNLAQVHTILKGKFSIPTIARFGLAAITMLKQLHEFGFCYTSLQPKHFLVGMGPNLGKFSLCGVHQMVGWNSSTTEASKKAILNDYPLNTYSSVRRIEGLEPKPKDDLESLGYILLYFFTGVEFLGGEDVFECNELKKKGDLASICREVPREMLVYFEALKETPETELPKYDYLKSAFLTIINNHSPGKSNLGFEWIRYDAFIKGTLQFEDFRLTQEKTQNTLQVIQTDTINKKKLSTILEQNESFFAELESKQDVKLKDAFVIGDINFPSFFKKAMQPVYEKKYDRQQSTDYDDEEDYCDVWFKIKFLNSFTNT